MKPLIAFIVCAAFWGGVVGVAQNDRVLSGTIDIHVHSDPDNRPRSIDAIDVAKLARTRGMRAIVLKNHYDPTAALAYIVRKEVPGIEVFGGMKIGVSSRGSAVAVMSDKRFYVN